jgi:hypothetical protein
MPEFDTPDKQNTNFEEVWFYDMKDTWSSHCKTDPLPPPPTLLVYFVLGLYLVVHRSTPVGLLIYHSLFKTIILHATIRLRTMLFLNFMVNSSQFNKALMNMYQNKCQLQQTLIKKHLTDLSLLCPGIQLTVAVQSSH